MEFDDFMESVGSMIDMGCGQGLDLEWWATRTTRDDNRTPLDIRCVGVDRAPRLEIAHRYRNITYQQADFEQPVAVGRRLHDLIWCHDSFQYVLDPFTTLRNWSEVTAPGGMLILAVPQLTTVAANQQIYDQWDNMYWNWTMVSLMHVLAVSGWDCGTGFFRKRKDDAWLWAAVYKSTHGVLDPRTTTWYELAERSLVPESACRGIMKHGYLRQRDLVLKWIDKSNIAMADH